MGMAASQARYLQLTARKSNTEYEAQQISMARLELAKSTEKNSIEYNEALGNRHLLFVPLSETYGSQENLRQLTYADIVAPVLENGMGMRLENGLGKIVVPELPDPVPLGHELSDYIVDEDLKNPEYLETKLRNGNYYLSKQNPDPDDLNDEWVLQNWETTTFIADALNQDDDAVAASNYEVKNAEIQRKDKALELRLNQLNTERKAITTEMEALEKVIKDSVEKSYKTFGG